MATYVALLGGVNVGGHRVSMDRLRSEVEALGFTEVSTFIASGNVVFDTPRRPRADLEREIEEHLEAQLGWPAPTYVRSPAELVHAAELAPFGTLVEGTTHLVGFLKDRPSSARRRATEALSNDVDSFVVDGRELHWHIRGKSMDSTVKAKVLAEAVGGTITTRNATSLGKLVARLSGSAPLNRRW